MANAKVISGISGHRSVEIHLPSAGRDSSDCHSRNLAVMDDPQAAIKVSGATGSVGAHAVPLLRSGSGDN